MMKRALLLLTVLTTIISCSRNDKYFPSAIEQLTGEWELQSRVLNDQTPTDVENNRLIFSEDGDIRDYKGFFILEAEETISGEFSLNTQRPKITFEETNGNTTVYGFNLITASLILEYTNQNGDKIEDLYIKRSHF